MKTISMRIRGAKTELEEAGESTDGMVESTAKLREEIMALSGVDIMLDKNTFKSTYQIMDELATKWEDLSDIAQASIIELMAGKHQGNVFASLMSNFDTARAALDTSINSSGSALAEHAKWSESLEARLNKLKAAWQSLSQTFMKSDFLKGLIDVAIVFIDTLDKIIDKTGVILPLLAGFAAKNAFGKIFNTTKMMQFGGGLASIGDILAILANTFPNLTSVISSFIGVLTGATGSVAAFGAALKGLSLGSWITIAIAAIGIGISLYDKYTESAEELAERVEDVTTKYKEQHKELSKLKGDYDTSNEESMISRYGELSKGVNELGENLALTTDEYAEYQNIVEQIANTNPELIAGYNSQGKAILKNAGDVDKLAESYKNLIKEQNKEVLTGKDEDGNFKENFQNAKDILRDFNNDIRNTSAWYQTTGKDSNGNTIYLDNYSTDHLESLQELLGIGYDDENYDGLKDAIRKLTVDEKDQIAKLLEDSGIERDKIFNDAANDGIWNQETTSDYIFRALTKHTQKSQNALDKASKDINAYAEDLGTVTSAYFDQAFLGGDNEHGISERYSSKISEKVQGILGRTVSELDAGFYTDILNIDDQEARWQALTDRYNSILDAFADMSDTDEAKFEAAFDLKTKFNGGDISYGEYVKGVQEAGTLIDSLGLHDEVGKQIKLNLGLSDTNGDNVWSVEQYETMLTRLTDTEYPIRFSYDEAKAFLDDLTASEYSVAIDLLPDLGKFNNKESFEKYIEEQAKINEALNFKIDISAEKEGIETLNTALTESVSATGLSAEALESLQARYSKLEGYDPARLFERTAQGIHINRDEFNKLEKEVANSKIKEIDGSLETLTNAYEDVTEEIRNCSDEVERNELISKQLSYENQIRELLEMQAQYEGLTSAYNNWVNAQAAGEEGDVYDDVMEKLEAAKELRKQGLVGTNEFAAAVGFMSGKDTSAMTVDQIVSAYEESLPKMERYFTEGSKGAQNLLNDLNGVNKEWAYIDESGAWKLNIPIEDAAKELGTSVDAIEAILGKGTDYGLTINYDSVYEAVESLETLYTKAESANDRLKELGRTDITFSFESTNIDDLESQIEDAQNIVDELKKADLADNNKIDLSVEGAEDAQLVLETLMRQKQEVAKPEIMNISLAMVGDEKLGNVIKSLQDLQRYQNLYEIQIATGKNTVDTEAKIQEIVGNLKALKNENPEIFTKLNLDTEGFNNALDTISNTELDANIKTTPQLDQASVEVVKSSLSSIDATILAEVGIGNTDELKSIDGTANIEPILTKTVFEEPLTGIANITPVLTTTDVGTLTGKASITPSLTKSTLTVAIEAVPQVNGTANVNGTAFVGGTTGRAFKQGNWGIKGSGTALGGELGMETLVRDGRFYTIGDNGAEFFKYKQGDIIFNHKQTEELFKNGRVTSDGGRGKMFANGSAFVNGKAFDGGSATGEGSLYSAIKDAVKSAVGGGTLYDSDDKSSDSNNKSKSKSKSKSKFEETVDWIEVLIDRIERVINRLDKKVNSVYKTWSERNSALANQIGKVGEEINLQQQAYDRYLKEADSVGLSEKYASKVRDGTIDIEKITDEELKKKIDEYQQWYDKALDCKDVIEDLKETESELYAQIFEHLQSQYDAIVQGYEHTESMLNEYISQAEERGHIVSKQYYQALIENEKDNIEELKREQADLIAARDDAVESGKIAKYSEEWYNMCNEIDSVTQAIEEGATALLEYDNAMREIDWEIFDLIQERISGVSEEAEFLIELMSNKKLFDDDGKLTSQGLATIGLHAQNYNTHMYAADTYGEEIAKINKQIANDPYDQELINRRNELLELQRESILAAEDEKNSIRDLVEEGIELELDALQERIDKYNESIDAAKDLYEYQKDVQEQSEEIASLEKQRAAYLGNDSEEGKAKLQEIEVSLKEAKENLQETEHDKYISDQQALLDTLYNEYELILNQRLDNIDYLLEQVIESINIASSADGTIASALGSEGAIAVAVSNNATSIKDTLASESKNVGITLSSAMNSIWSTGDGNAKSVLTMYGEDFKTKSTTIITTLNGIRSSVNSMVSSLNKEAEKKTTANKTATSAKKNPTTSSSSSKKTTTTKKSSGDGTPKIGDRVKFVSGQYYYDSQGKKPLGSHNQGKYVYITNINKKDWATHGYHISTGNKLGKGDLGWLKLNQLSGYAAGKQNFLDDEVAWTQENEREFIVRPSDGAILTPIAKGDSVLTSVASKNIWDMANSPTEFIKDNLGIGAASVPNSNIQNSYIQNFENITFSMPNVRGYDELLKEMQKDPKFEKLILSMSIDRIAGKSSLAKGKSIR